MHEHAVVSHEHRSRETAALFESLGVQGNERNWGVYIDVYMILYNCI